MNPVVVALLWAAALAVPMANVPNAPTAMHPPQPVVRVMVNVSAQDQIKSQIENYMAEGLRSLGNAQLVDDNPRWTIDIVTAALQDPEGRIQGVGLSFVVLEHGPQMQMLVTQAQAWRYVIAGRFLQDKFIEQGMRQLVSRVD